MYQCKVLIYWPEGIRSEDQISSRPQSGVTGGQLMTGEAEFPDVTGPSPLLIPATAMKTVGWLWPKNIYSLIGK